MNPQPEGVLAGGQFAADRKDEPTSTLSPAVPEQRGVESGRHEDSVRMIALGSKEKLARKEVAEKFSTVREGYEKSMESGAY